MRKILIAIAGAAALIAFASPASASTDARPQPAAVSTPCAEQACDSVANMRQVGMKYAGKHRRGMGARCSESQNYADAQNASMRFATHRRRHGSLRYAAASRSRAETSFASLWT